VASRDRAQIAVVVEALEVPSALDALVTESGRARLRRHGDFIQLTVETVEPDGDVPSRREVDLLAGHNVVVTVHDGPVAAIEAFDEQLRGDTIVGELDSGSFVAALVDAVLSSYFTLVEEIEREVDHLDDLALRGHDSEKFLHEVIRLRRRIAHLRRAAAPHREAFSPLVRPDFTLDERIGAPWPHLLDRLERLIDSVENARDLLVGSFDIYLGGAAQRANDVMKALTVLSAVLLPSVVLAGVMGMNFKLAFFEDINNFWLVIGGMLVFAGGLLGLARFRHWI
jgi:magnesium transporter